MSVQLMITLYTVRVRFSDVTKRRILSTSALSFSEQSSESLSTVISIRRAWLAMSSITAAVLVVVAVLSATVSSAVLAVVRMRAMVMAVVRVRTMVWTVVRTMVRSVAAPATGSSRAPRLSEATCIIATASASTEAASKAAHHIHHVEERPGVEPRDSKGTGRTPAVGRGLLEQFLLLLVEGIIVRAAEIVVLVDLLPALADDWALALALVAGDAEVDVRGGATSGPLDAPDDALDEALGRDLDLAVLDQALEIKHHIKEDGTDHVARNEASRKAN
mmetsp:Transcript_4657/g.9078  ORF Transcript_4657/g.9078 Transcript_4657/m.9078 type:complete len:276 (+) Transcript_4657:71-898(+)